MAKTKRTRKEPVPKDRLIKLKLTLSQRAFFNQFYPEKTNILSGVLLRDIQNKVNLTQKELKTLDAKPREGGGFVWQSENDKLTTVCFTLAEITFLQGRVNDLDRRESISRDILDAALKIRDVNVQA